MYCQADKSSSKKSESESGTTFDRQLDFGKKGLEKEKLTGKNRRFL